MIGLGGRELSARGAGVGKGEQAGRSMFRNNLIRRKQGSGVELEKVA